MPVVNTGVFTGDSTFTLTNGSTAGRMLLVLATQKRNPTNLAGFTYNSTAGATYGLQTTDAGEFRTLASLWTDSELPAVAGTYNIARNPGTSGGTTYVVIELSGMDVGVAPEIISGSPLSGSDPFAVQFSNSASAFLGTAFVTEGAQGVSIGAGAGQTIYYSDSEKIATGESTSSANDSLEINTYPEASPFAYSGVALAEISGPSLSITDPIVPGTTITFTATGFSGAVNSVTASDGTSTLTLTNITNTTGDNYTAVVPALPAVGSSLQYTTFGSVTMTVGDGTSTAQDTTSLVTSAHPITTLGATFDTGELSWLYNFTPDPPPIEQGDQGTPQTAGITLEADGAMQLTLMERIT